MIATEEICVQTPAETVLRQVQVQPLRQVVAAFQVTMAALIVEVLTEAEAAVIAAQPQVVQAAEQTHNYLKDLI